MPLSPAPFYEDMAGGPPGGAAHWVTTSDDVRVRVGHWPAIGAAKGTVLMFPGRTEYIEKYGQTAEELAARGFAMLAIDWRGQGLADRLLDDKRIGHVAQFRDYQKDIAAALRAARELDLPRPWHLLAHSMGGCIGLRAVMEGLPVQSCAFTGPMWGIYMSPAVKPFGWSAAFAGTAFGQGNRLMLSTRPDNYVTYQPFDDNTLTTDPAMYKMMQDQLSQYPALGLGGPSLRWMREALSETTHLANRPSPDLPCVTFLGTNERIVDRDAVRARMAKWPRGLLDEVDTAEHEVLMETVAIRQRVFDRMERLFQGGDNRAAPEETAKA